MPITNAELIRLLKHAAGSFFSTRYTAPDELVKELDRRNNLCEKAAVRIASLTLSAAPSVAELRDAFAWWEHPLQGGERRIIYLSHRSVTPKVHRVYRDGTWEPLVDFIVRAYHEYLAYQYGHEPVPDAPDTIP